MNKFTVDDPIYGLPVDVCTFSDGKFSIMHKITHDVINGQFADIDGEICIILPLSCIDQASKSISANDAAEMLNVSRMRITQLCNEGKIRSAMIGSSLYVCYDDVASYKDSNRTPGRKPNA